MKIVGIMGYAQSGKNRAAEALYAEGWVALAFADSLRDMLWELNPIVSVDPIGKGGIDIIDLQEAVVGSSWDEAKKEWPEIRRLMQILGTECVRAHDEDFWIKQLDKKVTEARSSGAPGVVITDVRFPNEVEYIVDEQCGATLWISKPGVGPLNNHASEAMTESAADHVIVNDGTVDELWDKVLTAAGIARNVMYMNLYYDDGDTTPGSSLYDTYAQAFCEGNGIPGYRKTVEVRV